MAHLSIVDTDYTSNDHLRNDYHITQMCFDDSGFSFKLGGAALRSFLIRPLNIEHSLSLHCSCRGASSCQAQLRGMKRYGMVNTSTD